MRWYSVFCGRGAGVVEGEGEGMGGVDERKCCSEARAEWMSCGPSSGRDHRRGGGGGGGEGGAGKVALALEVELVWRPLASSRGVRLRRAARRR